MMAESVGEETGGIERAKGAKRQRTDWRRRGWGGGEIFLSADLSHSRSRDYFPVKYDHDLIKLGPRANKEMSVSLVHCG